jgi:two-component system response regulator AtoC
VSAEITHEGDPGSTVSRSEPERVKTGDMLLVTGDGRLFAHMLTDDDIVIGRAPDCEFVIDHPALSRRHAVVRRRPALTLQDLGSTNGTRLGRGIVRGGEPIALTSGESFHIGPFTFLVVAGRTAESSSGRSGRDKLVVDDPTIDRVSLLVRDIARSNVNVLVQGETGVGKEVLATTLHELSGRTGPLTRINCAALSETLLESELFGHEKGAFTGAVVAKEGLLEAAAGGTVFLDEIGELPMGIQAKLLRAVEAREIIRLGSTRAIAIDVRFLAATNRDLPASIAAGTFRHDLYFRLDGVSLRIPPLRERRGMIAQLALRFLGDAGRAAGRGPIRAAPELLSQLESYDWPGNVRELKAVIERAVLLSRGGEVGVRHLAYSPRPRERERDDDAAPPQPAAPVSFLDAAGAALVSMFTPEQLADRNRVLAALEECAGNQTRAARRLGISRTTLVNKLAFYRIRRPQRS